MRVYVQSIVSAKEFGTIISAQIEDRDHPLVGRTIRIKISGEIAPTIGETWDVDGEIKDTRWGRQVEAARAARVLPTGKLVCDFLAAHAPGVGLERARRLWTHFGMELTQVLGDAENIDEIASILAPDRPNLAPRLAAACVSAWQDAEAEAATVMWLAEKGVDSVAVARRVARILGEDAVPRLNENPYCLVPLLPWNQVDALGLKLFAEGGCTDPNRDPRRLVGAVDAAVKAAIADGHTAGDLPDLAAATGRLLNDAGLAALALSYGEDTSAYWLADGGWRAPGAGTLEDDLVERLKALLLSSSDISIPAQVELASRLARIGMQGRPLYPEQQDAVLTALASPLACLSGGAGVGKTTTTKAVCDLWEDLGGTVILAAVAGKAALRLSRSTGRLAMTVFRLLRGCEHEDEDKRIRITGQTLVIIDEASMLDLSSAHALLSHFETGARLLLVGDEAQLPPIGFGLIYHRLVTDTKVTSRLMTVHRQAQSTGIPLVAESIRKGATPNISKYEGEAKGVTLLESSQDSIGKHVIKVWSDLSASGHAPMVLTPLNDGPSGVRTLNQSLHSLCRDKLDIAELRGYLGQWYCAGEPVMFTRNDYQRGLWNGLLGKIEAINFDERSMYVQFDGETLQHEINADDLFDLQLAYALTGHKAQGSDSDVVIIALPTCRLLDRSWLYTAVTRAKQGVVLIGELATIKKAVERLGQADTRRVGFRWAS